MNYFLCGFWLIVISNPFFRLHAAEVFINNLIAEYKQLDVLTLTIGNLDYFGKEILEQLPLTVRKKIYKLEWTYDGINNKLPTNLDELLPNLIALKTKSALPENLKLLFANYKYFRWYDPNTREWIEEFDKLPARAFYKGENKIENNVANIPGEENLLESNFSMDEVFLLAGENPKHTPDEQDLGYHFEHDELIIDRSPITPLPEMIVPEVLFPVSQPVYHPPLGHHYGKIFSYDLKELNLLRLPFSKPIVKPQKESRLSLGNKQQAERRARTYSQTSEHKKIIHELICKNSLYTKIIKRFFGQIEYIKNAPNSVSPAIIPLPGPPGTGKTYVIKQLTENAGITLRVLKYHMQKSDVTLPLKEAIEQIADPVDADTGKTNILFFDEIQNVLSEEEIITKIKFLKTLHDVLEEKKKEYKKNAETIGKNTNNINLHNEEIKKAEENYESELKNIKDIIAKKEETYFLLQETFGTGYFSKTTKQSVAGYMQLFTDHAGNILTLKEKKREMTEFLEESEKNKGIIEENLKNIRLTVSKEEEKNLAAQTEQLRKQLEECEQTFKKNKKDLLDIESSLKVIKGPLAVLIKELQGDYPRLLGQYNDLKETNIITNQFMKTPAKFLSTMQTQSESTQAQSNWCLNRTIVFLAANNHALITRVNARFNSAQNKKQHINPEEYRKVYEEEINNEELQNMVLKKFTYYEAKAALNEFLGLVTEEIAQETSISSRLNIENFKEILPPGKQEWQDIILMQLQNMANNIAKELNQGGVGKISLMEEPEYNLQEEDLAEDIIFKINFDEKLIDFIYQKTTGILGFRTFIPKFNELLQGFDNELKIVLFELQEKHEEDFLLAADNYFSSTSETQKSVHKNQAYDAQRKIHSLRSLSVELGDNIANPIIIVKSHWDDEEASIHLKILEFPIEFSQEALITKDSPPQDSLPFANEVAAILVLGMSKFLSLPHPNIDLSACSVDADFIPKLWPDRTVSNFSYIYRKLMTSLGAIAVAKRLNNNVITKGHSGYISHLNRIINDLRQIFIKNEQEKNLCKKNKLPLQEVIGGNLAQIVLFQKIYNSEDNNEIIQYLFDSAAFFVDFYQNIINAIAQEIVSKKAKGNTLSFTSDEMKYLITHYWPGTDFIEHHEQNFFLGWLWKTPPTSTDFTSPDIVNGKIKNALLSNPVGCSNVLLCENENVRPEKMRKSQSSAFGFGGFTRWLGCFAENPLELIQFSAKERHKQGFVPPPCATLDPPIP